MKNFKTVARIGYYNGIKVIKGLHAKPWDDWYILDGNTIVGVAGEYVGDDLGDVFVSASDSEITEVHESEIEIVIEMR